MNNNPNSQNRRNRYTSQNNSQSPNDDTRARGFGYKAKGWTIDDGNFGTIAGNHYYQNYFTGESDEPQPTSRLQPMPYFGEAENMHIRGGNFTNLAGNVYGSPPSRKPDIYHTQSHPQFRRSYNVPGPGQGNQPVYYQNDPTGRSDEPQPTSRPQDMPHFQEAEDMYIRGGNFTNVGGNVYGSPPQAPRKPDIYHTQSHPQFRPGHRSYSVLGPGQGPSHDTADNIPCVDHSFRKEHTQSDPYFGTGYDPPNAPRPGQGPFHDPTNNVSWGEDNNGFRPDHTQSDPYVGTGYYPPNAPSPDQGSSHYPTNNPRPEDNYDDFRDPKFNGSYPPSCYTDGDNSNSSIPHGRNSNSPSTPHGHSRTPPHTSIRPTTNPDEPTRITVIQPPSHTTRTVQPSPPLPPHALNESIPAQDSAPGPSHDSEAIDAATSRTNGVKKKVIFFNLNKLRRDPNRK